MDKKLIEKWNESTKNIPDNKEPSPYSQDKEKLFPQNSLICDLGGGTGADAFYFIEKGHKVILVDISDYALSIAQAKASAMNLKESLSSVQCDLSEDPLPLDDSSVDAVFSHLATHYFSYERTREIFQEIVRILKQDGKAFIAVKSPEDGNELSFLKQTAREIEAGLFEDRGQLKARFTKTQFKALLTDLNIGDYHINEYIEDFSGRNDKIQSGNIIQSLTDIEFTK